MRVPAIEAAQSFVANNFPNSDGLSRTLFFAR